MNLTVDEIREGLDSTAKGGVKNSIKSSIKNSIKNIVTVFDATRFFAAFRP